MKKMFIVFITVILLLLVVNGHNSNPKVIISRLLRKGDICAGELRYKVYLLGILPVGKAVFSIEKIEEYNGQKVYHLNATANPLKIYAKFFNGYGILDSYIDMQDLSPILFRQKLVSPGKESADKEVIYDQKQGIMYREGVMRQIFPNTQDPLSLIFNLRHMDFDQAKGIELNINTNQKNYIFEGWAEPKEISINNKTYKMFLLKAEIRRRDKNPYHESNIKVILLKGKENIPIFIKIFASGILINARLVEIRREGVQNQ